MIQPKDKVLVTGCGGMLGEAVHKVFDGVCDVRFTDIDLNEEWLAHLDVSDTAAVAKYLESFSPDYIVHLAALTDMEYCETHTEEADATNAKSVETLAAYAAKNDIPLLYTSTAGVFDGEKDEYFEDDVPNPLSVYGKSKYGGEVFARTVPKHTIIRAGWMMGSGPRKDKKFINKIAKQLAAGATELKVVNDKLGTPCYTYDLAKSIKFLLDNGHYGTFHGACDGGGSRADVARFLLAELGLTTSVSVTEVDSDFFKDSYFAARPRSEQLVNVKLKALAPGLTRDWRVCLAEYVKAFDWGLAPVTVPEHARELL